MGARACVTGSFCALNERIFGVRRMHRRSKALRADPFVEGESG